MPENDILRFILLFFAMIILLAIVIRSIEAWANVRKEKHKFENIIRELDLRDRDGRILDSVKKKLKEVEDDLEDDSPRD